MRQQPAPESAAPTPNRPVTRPNLPNRPVRPGSEPPQVAAEAAPAEPIAPSEVLVRESAPVQPAAELTTPPPRPVRTVDQPAVSNRPMLKRPRSEAAEADAPARSPMREGPVRPRPATPEGEAPPRPRPAIELRHKPVRPAGGATEGQPATAGGAGTAVAAPGDEKRVPLTLRPPKRAKTWEEEEEEENQQKAAAKAAAKVSGGCRCLTRTKTNSWMKH
ncbi:MAG: hypothetical protein HC895_26335 [Leptolyngbyaceae cyanobacterium SM1_3_5]|nr:hypothetical protein [Leptolyngbyaceae cyanobacterium SM1_3_5]